jgi:hypothetical protein
MKLAYNGNPSPAFCCKKACNLDMLILPQGTNNNEYFFDIADTFIIYHTWQRMRKDTVSIVYSLDQKVYGVHEPWLSAHLSLAQTYVGTNAAHIRSNRVYNIDNREILYLPSNANWYHWLLDSFAYLVYLAFNDPGLLKTHYVLLGTLEPYQAQLVDYLLEKTGISANLLILKEEIHRNSVLSLPGCKIPDINIPAFERLTILRNFFRNSSKHFISNLTYGKQKLAIRRSQCNRIANDDEIYATLAKKGYKIIRPTQFSLVEKLALFSGCKSLFIPSGSDRCHFQTFCPDDCISIFLVPSTVLTANLDWIYGAWRYWYTGYDKTFFHVGNAQRSYKLDDCMPLAIDMPCLYDVDLIGESF